MTTTSEVLSKAADIIEKHGLAKGNYYDADTGCYCTVGAIARAVVGEHVESVDLYGVIDDHLLRDEYAAILACAGIFGRAEEGAVTIWNDSRERTQDEVISTLREAAKTAKAAGQ